MKTLIIGIAAAATLGVMSGKTMQPELQWGAHPAGPQFYAGGLQRVAGPFEDGPLEIAPVAMTSGPVPEHVYGTDWTRLNETPRYEVIPAKPVFVTYNDPPAEMAATLPADEPGDAPAEAFAPASAEDQSVQPASPDTLG